MLEALHSLVIHKPKLNATYKQILRVTKTALSSSLGQYFVLAEAALLKHDNLVGIAGLLRTMLTGTNQSLVEVNKTTLGTAMEC